MTHDQGYRCKLCLAPSPLQLAYSKSCSLVPTSAPDVNRNLLLGALLANSPKSRMVRMLVPLASLEEQELQAAVVAVEMHIAEETKK